MLINPIDQDRIKLFPKKDHKEYTRQADGGCNDAELIDEMRRAGDLKTLDPSNYPIPRIGIKERVLEADEGAGFRKGDFVYVKHYWPWGSEEKLTQVESIVGNEGIRSVEGRVYPIGLVRKAPTYTPPDAA